jgi:SAM-dependent methyltransferase
MAYVYSIPKSASFTGKGLLGYTFGPLQQKNLEIYVVEVEKGHDTFMISSKITRTYYVISGCGYFTIGDEQYNVKPGMLVEVPPKIEYCYSGKMTLLVLSQPRWFTGNDTFTKWNPDVVGRDSRCESYDKSWLTRLIRSTVFGKSPVNAYLQVNQRLWNIVPSFITACRPVAFYGAVLHKLACRQGVRAQAFSTCFLRNRPQLELIKRLVGCRPKGDELRVTVLGCSTGAEAYSVAWRIRSARPDVKLILHAVDVSKQAVEVARFGEYSLTASKLSSTQICDGMSADEIQELFERDGDTVRVKSWIKEGIKWCVGDAGDGEVVDALTAQDLVIANNFLCHMGPAEAERCLRNIARLVKPDGCIVVSGIDLDVRTKVASDLGWRPVEELQEEIHEGDPYLKRYWPCQYAGLEPLDKRRQNWKIRYAAVFRTNSVATASTRWHEREFREVPEDQDRVPVFSDGDHRAGE